MYHLLTLNITTFLLLHIKKDSSLKTWRVNSELPHLLINSTASDVGNAVHLCVHHSFLCQRLQRDANTNWVKSPQLLYCVHMEWQLILHHTNAMVS